MSEDLCKNCKMSIEKANKTRKNSCQKCLDGVHTKKEHYNEYMKAYQAERRKGKVGYSRGEYKVKDMCDR